MLHSPLDAYDDYREVNVGLGCLALSNRMSARRSHRSQGIQKKLGSNDLDSGNKRSFQSQSGFTSGLRRRHEVQGQHVSSNYADGELRRDQSE